MKTTIATINGKRHTIVRHEEDALLLRTEIRWHRNGGGEMYDPLDPYCHLATALPALPRKLTLEDAPLLYRYMAEGMIPIVTDDCRTEEGAFDGFTYSGNVSYRDTQTGDLSWITRSCKPEIIEAWHNGERVEVALEDN